MPTADQVYKNRFMTLDRLLDQRDRIIWQQPCELKTTGAVWWEGQPQIARPALWISTCKWLLSRGLIIECLRPKNSHYRHYSHVLVYAATPAAEDAFIDIDIATPATRRSLNPRP